MSEQQEENRRNLTYREYAEAEGISYEAVRKKVERNRQSPELKRGIITKGNKKYLTPEAQDFLSEHVRGKYIYKPDPDADALREENQKLRERVIQLQASLAVYERLQIGQDDHEKMNARLDELQAAFDAKKAEFELLKAQLDKIAEEMEKPRKRGIFGRIRGEQ